MNLRTVSAAFVYVGLLCVVSSDLPAQAPEIGAQTFTRASVGAGFSQTNPSVLSLAALEVGVPAALQVEPGLGRPLLGAALGLPLGMLAGAGIGYLVGPRDDVADGCMFLCIGSGPAVGLMIGTALGAGTGAHLMNDRRGNPLLTAAGSVLGAVAGFGLGLVAGSETSSTAIGLSIAIPLAIGLPAVAEWKSSR